MPSQIPVEAITEAVNIAGGQSALARLIGSTQGSVWRWVKGRCALPAEDVLKVEAATGVSRHRLRPDLYPDESGNDPADALDHAAADRRREACP